MRSYKVYGVKNGIEEYVTTVHSPREGKHAHSDMKAAGIYDSIRVRDCLGGIQFERDLHTGAKIQ